MQLVSRVGGKTEPISVERHHGRYIVEIGGVRHEVDTRALGPWVLSLLVEGDSHEVAVVRLGDGSYSVDWRGRSFVVDLVDPLTHLAEISRGEAGKLGKKIVKAYMPGRVVEVRVAGRRQGGSRPADDRARGDEDAERDPGRAFGRRRPGFRHRRRSG